MDNLEKNVRLSSLYDLYKNLLTEKQRQYFEEYYFNDESLKEVAENFNVSRNAIYLSLKEVEEALEDFEAKLSLKAKQDQKAELLNKLKVNADGDSLKIIEELEEI
ncbi:MAG: hypothetical protein K6F59_01265 [Gammaproteobacteria bacterium]|nr:hypothetical protein [Gammaproteobacteria bacterium]